MDNDNFFEFDTSNPPEDAFEGLEDEEYDALNDETFGSAAVDGDWEQGHEQMATLTEARRISRKQGLGNSLKQQENGSLLENLQNLSLLNYDEPRMGHGSAPINIIGYGDKSHVHRHIGSSLLGGHDLPGSPSNSIWTPSPDFDKLQPVTLQSSSNGVTRSFGQPPPGLHNLGELPPHMGLQTIKTVGEIEEEMKLQQNNRGPPPPPGGTMNAMRVEDFEREMARQSMNSRSQQPPGMGGPTHPSQHFNMQQQQRPGNFPGGVANNQNHLVRQFQRQFFVNQGNFPSPASQQYPRPHQQPPPQQQMHNHQHHHHQHNNQHQHPQQQQQQQMHQQQQFNMNNFPNNNHRKGMPNHHHPPPHHHHDQGQGHDNYGGGYHHYNNYHGHQQQQNHHHQYNNQRSPEGRFNNPNPHEGSWNGKQYNGRKFERRPYDQNQGKNNYDRPQNGYDDYSNHSGGRTRRDSEAEWEEWHRMREEDEYSGLMTPREKGWLKNIQAMQLNSENPYQDDYYYVMYSVKQQRKREEEVITIDGLQLMLPDRGKDGVREYEPPRLENSLGKLQVVSVNAPRKIIDLEVVHLDPSHPTTPLQRDMRKHRHLLLHIEKLFNVIMDLDDFERKIRHLPDCPTRDLYKSVSRQRASKLWELVTSSPERLVQLLSIRKGKSLLYRLLMWLDENAYVKLVTTVLQNMPLLTKRDAHDQYLSLFWPLTDRLVASSSQAQLLEFGEVLLAQGGASQKANLISALYNKYGVSLILALMVRGEQLAADIEGCVVWQQLLTAIITALASLPESTTKPFVESNKSPSSSTSSSSSGDLPQALPSVALAASPFRPAVHLFRCSGVDQQLLKLSQEKMAQLEVAHSKPAITNTQSPAKC